MGTSDKVAALERSAPLRGDLDPREVGLFMTRISEALKDLDDLVSEAGHVHSLDGLDDVDVPGPSNKDLLEFDSGAGKWTILTPGAGGGLDADLLDGLEASAFGRLAQNETVTGSWTFGAALGTPLIVGSDPGGTAPFRVGGRGRFGEGAYFDGGEFAPSPGDVGLGETGGILDLTARGSIRLKPDNDGTAPVYNFQTDHVDFPTKLVIADDLQAESITGKVYEGVVNAGHPDFTGANNAEKVDAAIQFANTNGHGWVMVPDSLIPYDPALMPNGHLDAVRMLREGQELDVYDVMAYGAAFDDSNDDAAAWQAAIDAVPDAGGIVWAPEGISRIGSTLVVPEVAADVAKPVTFMGQGRGRPNGNPVSWAQGSTALRFAGTGVLFDLRNGDASPTTFAGAFVGLSMHETGSGTSAIYGHHAKGGMTIRDVVCRGWDQSIRFDGQVFYAVMENVYANNASTYGLHVGNSTNGFILRSCRFNGNGSDGARFDSMAVLLNVVGCYFEGNGGIGLHVLEGAGEVNLLGNYFEGNTDHQVQVTGTGNLPILNDYGSYYRPNTNSTAVAIIVVKGAVNLHGIVVNDTDDIASAVLGRLGTPDVTAIGTSVINDNGIPLLSTAPSNWGEVTYINDDAAENDTDLPGGRTGSTGEVFWGNGVTVEHGVFFVGDDVSFSAGDVGIGEAGGRLEMEARGTINLTADNDGTPKALALSASGLQWGGGGAIASSGDVSQAGHTHTESDITDLDHYGQTDFDADLAAALLSGIGDVAAYSALGDGEVLVYDNVAGEWVHQTLSEAGIAAAGHTHPAGDIVSGLFADGRIAQSNVTQHEGALTIAESQITDGSVLARLAANETVSGQWTFSSRIISSNVGLILDLGSGYQMYRENSGNGSAGTRFWFDTDDGGELIIGPRSGSEALDLFRFQRVTAVKQEDGYFALGEISAPGSGSFARIFVDSGDGDLKVTFANGTTVTLATN